MQEIAATSHPIPILGATTLHSTTLQLDSIGNVPWNKTVTVSGRIADNNDGNGIAGGTITFTGTGAAKLRSVSTTSDGTFTVIGQAPNTGTLGT